MNSSATEVVSIQPVKYIKSAIPEMENNYLPLENIS